MSEKVKVTRIGLGLHSIVKVYCADTLKMKSFRKFWTISKTLRKNFL